VVQAGFISHRKSILLATGFIVLSSHDSRSSIYFPAALTNIEPACEEQNA